MALAASLGGRASWRRRACGASGAERAPSAVTAADARPLARRWRALWWARDAAAVGWRCCCRSAPILAQRAARAQLRPRRRASSGSRCCRCCSAAMGAAAGVVAGLARPWRGRAAPSALASAIVVASVAWGVWRFYAAPPIFGYDPFVGYFAGTLYDEDVAIAARARVGARSITSRCGAGGAGRVRARCSTATPLRLGRAARRAARGRSRCDRWRSPARRRCGTARATPRLRARSADDIARALGGERRTAHFVLHYSPTGPYAKEIDALRRRRTSCAGTQLDALLRRAPAPPVHAFLFDNAGAEARAHGRGAHLHRQAVAARDLPAARRLAARGDLRTSWRTCSPGAFGDPIFGVARARARRSTSGSSRASRSPPSGRAQPLTPHQIVKVLRDARLVDAAARRR